MKPGISILRWVAFVSASVVLIICAYNLGKAQYQADASGKSPQANKTIPVERGDNLIGVAKEMKQVLKEKQNLENEIEVRLRDALPYDGDLKMYRANEEDIERAVKSLAEFFKQLKS